MHAEAVLTAVRALIDFDGDLFRALVAGVLTYQLVNLVKLRPPGDVLDDFLAQVSPSLVLCECLDSIGPHVEFLRTSSYMEEYLEQLETCNHATIQTR